MSKSTKRTKRDPFKHVNARYNGAAKILGLLSRGVPLYTGDDATNHLCMKYGL